MKETEEKLYKAISTIKDALVTSTYVDGRYFINYISPGIETIFGYKPEEIIADPYSTWYDNIVEEDKPLMNISMEQVWLTGTVEVEYRVRHKNNSIRWILNRYWKESTDNDATHFHGIITDITSRKKIELALKEKEEKYSTLINSTADGILTIDATSTIVFCNQSLTQMFGYLPHELLGKNLTMLMPKRFRLLHAHGLSQYLKTHHKQIPWDAVELTGLRKNGEEFQVEVSFAKFHKDDELFFSGIIRDITSRKKIEDKLTAQNDLLQKIFDNVPIMIVLFDGNHNVTFVNRTWEIIMGWTIEEIKEHKLFDTICLQQRHFENGSSDKAKSQWRDTKVETRRGYPIDTSWMTIKLSDGSLISIGRDITDLKREQDEKNKLISHLSKQNIGLQQFSFIASHNLRGPLATITGLLNILKKLDADSEARHIIGMISNATVKLDNVIQDISTILNIQSHRLPLQVVSLRQIVSDVKISLSALIEQTDCTIETNVQSVDSFYTIKSYLHSIVYNLISNAIKYHSDDRKPIILVESFRINNSVGFHVKDNGTGIDLSKYGDKVFTLYQRFHTNIEGKGLGLYMVKTQVDALNGSIVLKSMPDRGSTFTITLPIAAEPID
jgi:PAS domain S-box-containing protein